MTPNPLTFPGHATSDGDALAAVDFKSSRINGWGVVLGMDPVSQRTDGRTRRAREAQEFYLDLWLNSPHWRVQHDAVRHGAEYRSLSRTLPSPGNGHTTGE